MSKEEIPDTLNYQANLLGDEYLRNLNRIYREHCIREDEELVKYQNKLERLFKEKE